MSPPAPQQDGAGASSSVPTPSAPHASRPFLELARAAGGASASADDHQACFEAAVARHGLSAAQRGRLIRYLDYMLEVNQVMNLTGERLFFRGLVFVSGILRGRRPSPVPPWHQAGAWLPAC